MEENMPICKKCTNEFPNFLEVEGRVRELRKRKYCPTCVPFRPEEEVWRKVHLKKEGVVRLCSSCGVSLSQRRKYCKTCNPRYMKWENTTIGDLKEKEGQLYGRTVRNVARDIYYRSSKPVKCLVCSYEKNFQVCHIIPVDKFSDTTTIADVNNISNLMALCPNHHWEFDNHAMDPHDLEKIQNAVGVQIYTIDTNVSKKRKVPRERDKKPCKGCTNTVTVYSTTGYCRACICRTNGMKNLRRPSFDELLQSVTAIGYRATGRKYGVSDGNVRKWLKRYGVDPKTVKKI